MRNTDIFVWPYDYSISQALYEKIMAQYEAVKGTYNEKGFIERLQQWISNMEYPQDFHNNHKALLKCIIKDSRSYKR